MPKASRSESKVIVGAREGHAARAAALEQIADLNEASSKEDDPSFDPESTYAEPGEEAPPEQPSAEPERAQGDEPEEPSEPAEPAPEEEQPTEPEEGEPAAPAKQAVPPERKYKIRVNGRDLELSFDELVARAQKVEAADQYLAEAARVRNLANAPSASSADARSAAHPSDEEDAATVRALQLGTEEEAIHALRKLRDTVSAKPDQMVATVDERFSQLQAFDRFRNEYSDIMGDDVLRNLAFALDKTFLDNGDRRTYADRYKEVGDLVRSKVRSWATQFAPDAEGRLRDKAQRKAQAPSTPKAAGSKAKPAPEEAEDDGPEDYSKWIAQEAERRGKHYGVS